MRILLITTQRRARGGREQLSDLLMESLRAIAGCALEIFQLPPAPDLSVAQKLLGRIDGITQVTEGQIVAQVLKTTPDCVFIDGSNLGRLARLIKRTNTHILTVTFYHNVEARFFFDGLRASRSLRALGVFAANALAEWWASEHSDRRIMLNMRDSRLLARIYRKAGTDLLPMALLDRYDPVAANSLPPHPSPYALFVGGAFYANVEGMAWYAREVAPSAPIETVVVGRGMEAYRDRLEANGRVKVIGAVDDLAAWYAHARLVVAPILSGSGMKTKTAEALMHGKPFAGTPEAFAGYRSGWSDQLMLCRTSADFIKAQHAALQREPGFDADLRAHYEAHHSVSALHARLSGILHSAFDSAGDFAQ